MCQQLRELREAIGNIARELEPARLSPAVAEAAVTDAAAIEHMAATIKVMVAVRAAESGTWRRSGQRSPAEGLARLTGVSVAVARDSLQTGRRLSEQPEVAAAACQGKLSPAQIAMITTAAAANPAAQRSLLSSAAAGSISELRDQCVRVKTGASLDLEQRRRDIHNDRRLRSWTDVEGLWHLHASGAPEHGAQFMSALAPIADQLFQEARTAGRRDHPDAYAFDALVELARESILTELAVHAPDVVPDASESGLSRSGERRVRSMPDVAADRSAGPTARATVRPTGTGRRRRGPPVKLLLRVDYDTWLRGVALDGETCELAGYGPVPVSTVRDLLGAGNPFVAAILTRGKALVGVAHLGRQPTAHQQSALEWLYPSCAVAGCAAQARLQTDHRLDWAKTHYTMLDLLDRLCAHHHQLKTQENWCLVDGSGKRAFVPPDDPRHPGRCQGRAPNHSPP